MEDSDVIREQIEQTRSSLSDKIETLEGRVTTTVQEASKAVDNVTGAVEETVATVTDSVQETVTSVKDTVDDTLTAVKDSVGAVKSLFDLPRHVDRYPWVAVGGSLAVGFLLGEVLLSRHTRSGRGPSDSPPQSHAAAVSSNGNGRRGDARASASAEGDGGLLDRFQPELSKLTGLALGVLMGTFREMVANAAGESLGESVSEIIDSVTEKIGGIPIPHERQSKDETYEQGADMPSRTRAERAEYAGEAAHMTA